jgi:hypothetical protein
MAPTHQQQVWDWLKAEARYAVAVKRWLRAEGVSEHVLRERRLGRPEAPRRMNRAAVRAFRKQLRKKK